MIVHAAVDADAAFEPIGLFVDRPVLIVAEMILRAHDAGARQHGAAKAQLFDDAAQFFHRFLRLLQRDQPERLKARALAEILVVHPVVVGARQLDGPVAG